VAFDMRPKLPRFWKEQFFGHVGRVSRLEQMPASTSKEFGPARNAWMVLMDAKPGQFSGPASGQDWAFPGA
jgi:hypothetical protein